MRSYSNDYGVSCNCSPNCTIAAGNSLDVEVNCHESEIRADVCVSEYSSVRLWGRIVNCQGKPVSNALVKLLKIECSNDRGCGHGNQCVNYTGVAHTVTDCDGFYQFEICCCDNQADNCYRILVSKAAYGPERIIPISGANCDPCDCDSSQNFNPCKVYPTIVTPPGDIGYGSKCCDKGKYQGGCHY